MIAALTLRKRLSWEDLKRVVNEAGRYGSSIFLTKENYQVNVKSILGLGSLTLASNDQVQLVVQGSDEKEALENLLKLLN